MYRVKEVAGEYIINSWRWSLYAIIFVIFITFGERKPDRFSPIWKEGNQRTFINGDGHGYYGYLPAFFLYQDLKFSFLDDVMQHGAEHSQTFDDFRRYTDGGIVNITYMGVSILWIPFFWSAHLVALITNFEANGYSTPYQLAILFAAIFYLWLGLWAFGRFLEGWKIKPRIISFCLILMVFATSTINYVIDEPSMTHVYSLMLFSVFILYTQRFFKSFSVKHLWLALISLALIGLTRPTNAMMVLAIPLVAGSWEKLSIAFRWALANPFKVLLPVILFFLILALQPILYLVQTGSFFVWSYQEGATFSFSNPHIREVLFSYERGLFLYTPILLIALFGLPGLFKENRFVFFWTLTLLIVPIYILASWWNWWFGGSFGNRAFIEYYPVYFLIFALGLHYIKTQLIRHFIVFISVVLIAFNLIQFHQFRNYIFYWIMDKEMYQKVFLRISNPWEGILYETGKLESSIVSLTTNFPVKISESHDGFEIAANNDGLERVKGVAHTGVYSVLLDQKEFSPPLYHLNIPDSLTGKNMGILAQLFLYPEQFNQNNPVYAVLEVFRDNNSVYRLESTPRFSKQWNRINFISDGGLKFEKNDYLILYVFNPYKKSIYIDDVSISFWDGSNDI